MFYGIRDRLRRAKFNWLCRTILSSPKANLNVDSPMALLTQLQHKDVLLALIAFKSFAARVSVGAIYILDDGSLTPQDYELLNEHLPALTLFHVSDINSGVCPRGGCWERLLTIAELVKNHYVIQLDSDTLTLGNIPEIHEYLMHNKSFVIGTWDNQELEPMATRQQEASRLIVGATGKPHIQLTAEANFNHLKRFEALQYVRGCAGFSGFAKGSFDRAFVEEISGQMQQALGDRWREWGSEQVMSNIVVANTPIARVLPHPKYCDCTRIRPGETVFIHFIGSCRFLGGTYAGLARRVIKDLTPD